MGFQQRNGRLLHQAESEAPIISFERVSKRFTLQHERARSFQDAVLNILHRRNRHREEFWALKDVSLMVRRGEMLGLIGPNGAGKSTILKLMTRILEPTSGTVTVRGRVAALLELGTGFHPDLTGRENVFLNGSLLGFTRDQMEERLDSIIAFADMERFIDVPVRHYSSGMYMRLGFAIAVHSDPDILITDEVLAVGDEAFQNKCLARMRKFRDDGVTIILVSHALPVVRALCDRVIWLRQGSIVQDGAPDDVVNAYMADVTPGAKGTDEAPMHVAPAPPPVAGLADLFLTAVAMVAADGQPRWRMRAGEPMALRLHYRARKAEDVTVHVETRDAEDGTPITAFAMPTVLSAGEGVLDVPVAAWPLRQGGYELTVSLLSGSGGTTDAAPGMNRYTYTFKVDSSLTAPHRRWGDGQALVEDVSLYNADGQPQQEFATGETMRVRLRCISTSEPIADVVLRVRIYDTRGVLCHATNTERAGVRLGPLSVPKNVTLTYDSLSLLEGEYTLSLALTPADCLHRPYDQHDAAYPFRVRSSERDGAGLVALSHRWQVDDL